jgi:hypothetical protein
VIQQLLWKNFPSRRLLVPPGDTRGCRTRRQVAAILSTIVEEGNSIFLHHTAAPCRSLRGLDASHRTLILGIRLLDRGKFFHDSVIHFQSSGHSSARMDRKLTRSALKPFKTTAQTTAGGHSGAVGLGILPSLIPGGDQVENVWRRAEGP